MIAPSKYRWVTTLSRIISWFPKIFILYKLYNVDTYFVQISHYTLVVLTDKLLHRRKLLS